MKAKITLIILLIGFLSTSLRAQDNNVVTSDLELWTTVGASKKLGDHFKVHLDNEFRFNTNATVFDVYFSELGFDFRPVKFIELGIDYRFYQNKNKKDVFETEHRFSGDLKFKYEIKRFEISYRMRVQNKDEDFYLKDNTSNNTKNLRNKLQLEYDIKNFKFNPYVSSELFRSFGDGQEAYFNKLRLTAGISYNLKKVGKFDIFYRLDEGLNLGYSNSTYIMGLGYNYKF